MSTNLTTVFEKVQVGTPDSPNPYFIIRCTGKTGAFGLPSFTEPERDLLWLPGDFPNPEWIGGMIYNETTQRVQFNTGASWFTFEAGAPPSSIAAFYQQYVDDAEYTANQGAAVNGSVYYNTTIKTVRVYSNGNWYNDLVPEPWSNLTDYVIGQIVWDSLDRIFRCTTLHTSSAGPATIDDDSVNWSPMGAHNIGELNDVDTTGIIDGQILVWSTDKFIAVANGILEKELTIKELAADPVAPSVGYVNIYAKTDKRVYLQDSNGKITLLEVPLDVLHYKIQDASALDAGGWVELVPVTSAIVRRMQAFDLTGMNLEIGIGASGSEVVKCVTGQGTNESIDVEIASGSRIAIRAADGADAYEGQLVFNFLG